MGSDLAQGDQIEMELVELSTSRPRKTRIDSDTMISYCTSRRFFVFLLPLVLVVAILTSIGFVSLGFNSIQNFKLIPSPITQICANIQAPAEEHTVLLSPTPTAKFKDNLRNDSYYITAWPGAGFTNQFMGYVNMIYLATLADRIPILPPFAPGHMSPSARVFPFGDVYDLDHLRKELQISILEWRDVKQLYAPPSEESHSWSPTVEELGCWTTSKEISENGANVSPLSGHLGIDASYTRVPLFTRFQKSDPKNELHVVFAQLAALIFPENPVMRTTDLKVLRPSRKGTQHLPDDQLSCFDSLYYGTSGAGAYEWTESWSPAWKKVGRYLRYTSAMNQLGREYIYRILNSSGSADDYPPFIALHVRRTDFSGHCPTVDGKHVDCFPPLSAYGKYVEDIKSAWLAKSNLTISTVIVMSDEVSPAFWDDVKSQGWYAVDHVREQTIERFGEWHAVIIDSVIQSLAVGLVGTKHSTFTLVSERRVHDWNGGFGREVDIRTGQ